MCDPPGSSLFSSPPLFSLLSSSLLHSSTHREKVASGERVSQRWPVAMEHRLHFSSPPSRRRPFLTGSSPHNSIAEPSDILSPRAGGASSSLHAAVAAAASYSLLLRACAGVAASFLWHRSAPQAGAASVQLARERKRGVCG